eukprot:TRINITY_DN76367_c0_g1_i1.p1 TRINITY_DN76367_c0_g1~~TRINITY_DN76367_c0_g1_i1.p1  ORF type:complete len:443 (-),score=31.44 TRINITY_DN76367_c0_g1_i1:3-1331(-)
MHFASWPDGLLGIRRDGFFTVPRWVDTSALPGHTDQTEQVDLGQTVQGVVMLRYHVFSHVLGFAMLALAVYSVAPYDLDQAIHAWTAQLLFGRLRVNYPLAFLFYLTWHISLGTFQFAKRPYRQATHTAANLLHDLWYWSLGVLQWSFWESLMMYLWASGRVPYQTDAEVLASASKLAWNILLFAVSSPMEDLHFYFMHRFIHLRAIYRFVHSVHHRNINPQPFSGLAMHPVEHMMYFSAMFIPAVLVPCSPYLFLFLGWYTALGACAGHTGYEDHSGSSQFHFLHHAYFECNYGSGASNFLDKFFGTFRGKLSSAHAGNRGEKDTKKANPHSCLGLQKGSQLVYSIVVLAIILIFYWGLAMNRGPHRIATVGGVPIGVLIGACVAYGPFVIALLLCKNSSDSMHWRWPFQQEKIIGAFGISVFIALASCNFPLYVAARLST